MLDFLYHEPLDWQQMFLTGKLKEYDRRKAAVAACLARDSYYDDARHNATMLALGFHDAQLFYNNNLQAIAGCRDIQGDDETRALIAIVFRGSDQIQDWLQNIDVRMTRFLNSEKYSHLSRIRVHHGIFENVHDFEKKAEKIAFQTGFLKASLPQIIRDESINRQCLFWIIGHSLGGAMATLFAARLFDYYGIPADRILVHTFGAPPIGNRYFAARYGHQSTFRVQKTKKDVLLNEFRFVNTEDPIPAPRFANEAQEEAEGGSIMQPPYKLLGFKHVGQEIRFSPRVLTGFYEKYQAFTGRRYDSAHFMKVHFMEAYMTGLDAMTPQEV